MTNNGREKYMPRTINHGDCYLGTNFSGSSRTDNALDHVLRQASNRFLNYMSKHHTAKYSLYSAGKMY